MKYEFEVGYDFITNFAAPGYNNMEISTLLTKAQEKVIYDINSNGLEYNEKQRNSTSKLKVFTDSLTINSGGLHPNGCNVVAPINVLYIIQERADIVFNSTSPYYNINNTHIKNNITIKPITDDQYNANINNPSKKPFHNMVWKCDYVDTDLKYELICDSTFTVDTYYLHYIKKPDPIIIEDSTYSSGSIDGKNWASYTTGSLDCELDASIHREIVDKAVKLAFAAIQDEKGYQISNVEEQQKKQ